MAKNILEPIQASSWLTTKRLTLKQTGQVSFSGLIGSSASALLAVLRSHYANMLIIVGSSAQAQALKA